MESKTDLEMEIEDSIMGFAKRNGYDEFYEKWSKESYGRPRYTLNMAVELLKEVEKNKKIINKFGSLTLLNMAQILEDGLLHSGTLDKNMKMKEFIEKYTDDIVR